MQPRLPGIAASKTGGGQGFSVRMSLVRAVPSDVWPHRMLGLVHGLFPHKPAAIVFSLWHPSIFFFKKIKVRLIQQELKMLFVTFSLSEQHNSDFELITQLPRVGLILLCISHTCIGQWDLSDSYPCNFPVDTFRGEGLVHIIFPTWCNVDMLRHLWQCTWGQHHNCQSNTMERTWDSYTFAEWSCHSGLDFT